MTTNRPTIGNDAGEMVGVSQALVGVLEQVRAVAPTDATVLIYGETGVGKELTARRVHDESRRCCGPMIAETAPLFPAIFSKASSSGTHAEPSRAQPATGRDESKLQMAELSFSMKSERFRWSCKVSCCAPCSICRSSESAKIGRVGPTCDSLPLPTVISYRRFQRAASDWISTIA